MEKRIELERRGQPPESIRELNLDNCRSTCVVGLTEDFVNLENLSMINVGLTSLTKFPKLPNLRKLELSDNRISKGLEHLLGSPKLTYLSLSGNKIKELEALQPLQKLENLKCLDLFNCEIQTDRSNTPEETKSYRDEIFNLIPSLKYLDGSDRNGSEADDETDSTGDEDENEGNKLAAELHSTIMFLLQTPPKQSFNFKSFALPVQKAREALLNYARGANESIAHSKKPKFEGKSNVFDQFTNSQFFVGPISMKLKQL